MINYLLPDVKLFNPFATIASEIQRKCMFWDTNFKLVSIFSEKGQRYENMLKY